MQHAAAKTLPGNPFLALLREAKPEIDRRLVLCLDQELERMGSTGRAVQEMLLAAKELSLRGGKRLRAALVLAGQKATEARASRWDRGLDVGVAVELLQSYLLIHDDWMDQDDRRRGGPSVHVVLARRFRSAHAGACGAVLAGDYLAALATRELARAVRTHPRQATIVQAFADIQLSTVAGQQLDATRLDRDAEKVYELKTAAYTVAGPLQLGALLAGADARTQRALGRFARPLGIAFQLRDDLLGLFAPPARTGKPLANDLREGKRTWTLEWALGHASARERRQIRAAFGMKSASTRDVRAALDAVRSSGAEAATESRLTAQVTTALRALSAARLKPSGEALLLGAARALLERGS